MMCKYINPPLNYMGGKFKLLSQLEPLMDYDKLTFYDVFAGGGSVAMNLGKNYSQVHMNDLLSIGIHKGLYLDAEEIVEEMLLNVPSKEDKEGYSNLRASYNNTPTASKLWALILSCNSNMMRFNKKGKFNQTWGKRSYNSSTEQKIQAYKQRVYEFNRFGIPIKHTAFSYKDFDWYEDPSSMSYLDPPYFNTEAGYNVFWSLQDEYNLLELCLQAKGSVAVSGCLFNHKENSPLLLGLLEAGWNKYELDMSYQKSRKNKEGEYQEILLTNYDT